MKRHEHRQRDGTKNSSHKTSCPFIISQIKKEFINVISYMALYMRNKRKKNKKYGSENQIQQLYTTKLMFYIKNPIGSYHTTNFINMHASACLSEVCLVLVVSSKLKWFPLMFLVNIVHFHYVFVMGVL